MELLKYCVKEILIVYELLKLENSSFYKRCLARFICIRIDDFIKLGFKLNKDALNVQKIKDELKDLSLFYEEFLKLQRDKYGAHVQDLDLLARIEVWLDIDIERIEFFATQSISIYTLFQTLPGYQTHNELFSEIETNVASRIVSINDELDLEDTPRLGTDILSLTRHNSSSLINFHPMLDKAGVLKSLELIIDYEMALLDALETQSDLENIIKKMFCLDVISYCDNLFTRTDLRPEAPQQMDGLDKFITEVNYPKCFELIREFRGGYKLIEKTTRIRNVRNKTCGHIPITETPEDLVTVLQSISISSIKEFYVEVKNLFRQVCSVESVLNKFLTEPVKLYDVLGFIHKPRKAFSPEMVPETVFEGLDMNSNEEIERHYLQWIEGSNSEDVRQFFWSGFSSSVILANKNFEITTTENERRFINIEYRMHHDYFERKLNSNDVNVEAKIRIVQLFIDCANGYPETLCHILMETYEVNRENKKLNLAYINAFGTLAGKRYRKLFDYLISNYDRKDLYKSLLTIKSLFKINLFSRRLGYSNNADLDNNKISEFIDKTVSGEDYFEIICILMMAGEAEFGEKSHFKNLKEYYAERLNQQFQTAFKTYVNYNILGEEDKEKVNDIIDLFKISRYIASISSIADFFLKKGNKSTANNFMLLASKNLIAFAHWDEAELRNLAFIYWKLDLLPETVRIFEHLSRKSPTDMDLKTNLLSLYRQNKQQEKFDNLKRLLLNDFVLSTEQRSKITESLFE